ncbi:VOC family protein [Streptomonospora sediminis]
MAKTMFVNLPVADLQTSVDFFTGLGFEFNPDFTDENATAMMVGSDAIVMLLVKDFFQSFTKKDVADARASTEAIIAVSADSREEVDETVNKALATGGSPANEPIEGPGMYGWSFQDPDGHLWEYVYMDPSAMGSS